MSMIRDEDVLALFEEDRGDLTLPDSPTQGEKALRSPPDAQQAERRSRA